MQRYGRIAIGAALAGLIAAVTLVGASAPERGPVQAMIEPHDWPVLPEPALERCRTATVSDTQCEAVWEDRRRHFFGADRAP